LKVIETHFDDIFLEILGTIDQTNFDEVVDSFTAALAFRVQEIKRFKSVKDAHETISVVNTEDGVDLTGDIYIDTDVWDGGTSHIAFKMLEDGFQFMAQKKAYEYKIGYP
jgi:hypothetical protein